MESKCPSAPLKCPCCGADLMQCDRGKSCRCCACRFRCERVHLSHISAAMELARAKTKRARTMRSVFNDWDDNDEKLFRAEMRVLEVFGGE